MSRICHDFTCGNAVPGTPSPAGQCPKCWAAMHRPAVAASLGRTAVSVIPRTLPCLHEGGVVERCHTCGTNGGRHVRECDLHNRCTRSYVGPRVRSCDRCGEYAPDLLPAVTTRHLLYHLYPINSTAACDWRWNVEQLCQRMSLFNGRRIVAVALDPPSGRWPAPKGKGSPVGRTQVNFSCATLDDVRSAFGPHADSIEFVTCENDAAMCELMSFDLLFGRLRNEVDNPSAAIFYGHDKGTTRPATATAIRWWVETLYETHLDYWPVVADLLRRFPLAGSFKKLGKAWHPWQSASEWHYSGSFLWARCNELYRRDWRRVDRFWSGIECWPSLHFSASEAGCIFHEGLSTVVDCYKRTYWEKVLLPELAAWRGRLPDSTRRQRP